MNPNSLESAASTRLQEIPDHRVATRSAERLLGSFYTGVLATEVLARWAIRSPHDRLLEPSFGDGAFLNTIQKLTTLSGFTDIRVFGAELVPDAYAAAVGNGLVAERNAFLGDFLGLEPFEVDAVVGNPPYVRLRHLPAEQRVTAMRAAKRVLGTEMEISGSVWMPFVLHSLRFLRPGGRLALVLPHEITYVRYARSLWRVLGESFNFLRVVRVRERLFPEILQEVVLLLADGYGGSTSTVEFQVCERADELRHSPTTCSSLALADIVAGDRTFLTALLPSRTRSWLGDFLAGKAEPLPDRCAVHIGYVAGDKSFFHPTPDVVDRFKLPKRSLRPAITSSRRLRTAGLRTSNATSDPEVLYLPPEKVALAEGEEAYLQAGRRGKIHERYKCRVREPWFRVPGVRVPDVLLSVFAEQPVLAINDARLVASNSLLCGYLKAGTAEELAAAWYTSLTLLQCELQVHSLGGGVLILVPGEVGKVRLPATRPSKTHLAALDTKLRTEGVEAAYRYGDEQVLRRQFRLSLAEIDEIRTAIDLLRRWRTSSGRSRDPRPEEANDVE